ncbi:MAG: hypothetical protein PVG49_16025 [Desulfobacteraceae bacterium]|jgi:hypothetical protein
MAITLGGIGLPDLTIENEFGWTGVEAAVDRSVGRVPIIWEREISGQALDLVGTADTAWITRATLKALRALAAVLRATYTLNYEGTEYTVRFRNEDGEAIYAEPRVPRPNHEDTDYYRNVRIRLMIF